MKYAFVAVTVLIVGVIAWLQKTKQDAMNEPDLPTRYRAAWNITNDEIRKAS